MLSRIPQPRVQAGRRRKAFVSENALVVARQALSIASQLRRSEEVKEFQLSSQNTNFLAGTVTQLAPIAQGVTVANRVGDVVRAQRFRLRMKCYILTPSNSTFRVMLVRATGATVPSVTNVLTTDDTQSMRNLALDDTYVVLKDETVTINAAFLNGDRAGQLDWDIGLNNLPISFQAAATTYERNGLFLLITTDFADSSSAVSKPAIGDSGMIFRSSLLYTDA